MQLKHLILNIIALACVYNAYGMEKRKNYQSFEKAFLAYKKQQEKKRENARFYKQLANMHYEDDEYGQYQQAADKALELRQAKLNNKK